MVVELNIKDRWLIKELKQIIRRDIAVIPVDRLDYAVFGLVWFGFFNGISTVVGYLMPNLFS